jgi:hypothetical protein
LTGLEVKEERPQQGDRRDCKMLTHARLYMYAGWPPYIYRGSIEADLCQLDGEWRTTQLKLSYNIEKNMMTVS